MAVNCPAKSSGRPILRSERDRCRAGLVLDSGRIGTLESWGLPPADSPGPRHPMRAQSLQTPPSVRPGRSWPLVVLMLACSMATEATASSVGSFDEAEHARVCHCGPKCRGASCCCGSPKKVEAPVKPSTAGVPRTTLADLPCLGPSPCQDPLLPPSTPVGSSEKVAASPSCDLPPDPLGRRLDPSRSSRLPSDRRASRLDRPPKALASA